VKYFNGWLSYHFSINKNKFSSRIGLGLNTQGIIAITTMVSFQQVFNNQLFNSLFAIVVVAVIVNEIISIKLTKDLLIDLSEIK
jgi:hypothetical protein